VNNKTREETLRALHTKQVVAHFIATHQGMPPAQIQRDILSLCDRLASTPAPKPAAVRVQRAIVTGGRNE
jgi:hypothetical protein